MILIIGNIKRDFVCVCVAARRAGQNRASDVLELEFQHL